MDTFKIKLEKADKWLSWVNDCWYGTGNVPTAFTKNEVIDIVKLLRKCYVYRFTIYNIDKNAELYVNLLSGEPELSWLDTYTIESAKHENKPITIGNRGRFKLVLKKKTAC